MTEFFQKQTPQRLDASLELLDRQLVDPEGRFVGKVDDLELTAPDDGSAPYVSAILSGPGALAARIGGRLGRWIESAHARLQRREAEGPSRISFGVVKRVRADLELSLPAEDLPTHRAESWTSRHVVARIPGADRATE